MLDTTIKRYRLCRTALNRERSMRRSMPREFGPIALAAALALGLPSAAVADNFPEKPIKLIVPFGAGGPPDVAARIIGAYLSDHPRPGAGGKHIGCRGPP